MGMIKFQILQGSTESISAGFVSRPSACTVALYGANGDELTADGTSGRNLGLATTVSAASGISQDDRRELNVTSITDVKYKDIYKVINAAKQYEYVQVLKVPADGALSVAQELEYDYASADTFEDPTVYRALTATETATLGTDYRARFTATIDGETVVEDVIFDIVISKLKQPITAKNLRKYDPILNRLEPPEGRGTDWSNYLETTWSYVYDDIVAAGVRPSLIRDEKQLAPLHRYKLKKTLAEDGFKVGDMFDRHAIENASKEYNALFNRTINRITWVDSNEDNIPNSDEKQKNYREIIL